MGANPVLRAIKTGGEMAAPLGDDRLAPLEDLFLTPSALTRQIQRLEQALGTPLLDRRVKPARFTPAGRAVLDRGRHVLHVMDDLKAPASDAAPSGSFRSASRTRYRSGASSRIQRLPSRFPRLRLTMPSGETPSDARSHGRSDRAPRRGQRARNFALAC